MPYSQMIWNFYNPKWGALSIGIASDGNLLLQGAPTLNPNIKTRDIRKGEKVFDYDKSIIVKLTLSEVINLGDMLAAVGEQEDAQLDIFRQVEGIDKHITVKKTKDWKGVVFYFTDKVNNIKFKVPIAESTAHTINRLIDGFVNCYPLLRFLCAADNSNTSQ